jgi:hypothetical protein
VNFVSLYFRTLCLDVDAGIGLLRLALQRFVPLDLTVPLGLYPHTAAFINTKKRSHFSTKAYLRTSRCFALSKFEDHARDPRRRPLCARRLIATAPIGRGPFGGPFGIGALSGAWALPGVRSETIGGGGLSVGLGVGLSVGLREGGLGLSQLLGCRPHRLLVAQDLSLKTHFGNVMTLFPNALCGI